MRRNRIIFRTAFVIMLTAACRAETASSEYAQAGAWNVRAIDMPISEQLGLPKWLVFGGQYRARLEDDTALSFVPRNSDTYYLQRIRLNLTVTATPWLRFRADFQDSHNYFYGNRAFAPYTSDPFDLHQAFVEIGTQEDKGFSVRAGRQEVILGSQRLVGSGDWLNSGRSHDIVRGAYRNAAAGVNIDVIAGSLVLVNPKGFDQHIPGEHWYAVYTTFKKVAPRASVEPYYFLKTTWNSKGEHGGIADTYVSTFGGRVIGSAPGRFDYSVELARQMGHYATDPIRAMAGAYVFGWQAASTGSKPRLSVEYDHASGDTNSKDGVRQTFDNMYCGHGYYGFADQLGWKNMRVERAGFNFSPSRKLQIRVDVLNDFLATTQDALYSVGGALKVLDRNAKSTHLGEEADFLAIYDLSSNVQFKAGFNHIFPGAYLKQATKGSGYSCPFVMWTKNF